MIRIFNTLLHDGTWVKRAFNMDHIIAARPSDKDSIIISNLFGEFEVRAKLEDLEDKFLTIKGEALGELK